MNQVVAVIDLILTIYWLILVIRVFMSWVRVDPYSPFAQFIFRLTEPFLRPIRSLLPQSGPLDFSPMVGMLIIFVIQQILRTL